MRIGFIGVGVMGSRMVKRLLDAGYFVTVYNRSPEKVGPIIELGAQSADSIAELVGSSEIVCTCLSMPSDSIQVYLGSEGILECIDEGAICIDFTTVDAATSRTIYAKAKHKGIAYFDAPVSGGPEGVENGTLTIMVGGDLQLFDSIKPLLKHLGEMVKFLGPAGSGSIAKLINQYLVAVHSLAVSEAMVTGASMGLDSEQLYDILKMSYGDSRILRRHMEHFVLDRQFEPGGAIKYVHKDVRLANKLVHEAGIQSYTGELAEQAFDSAIEEGLADYDMSAVIQTLEKQSKVIVSRHKKGL